MVGFGRSRTKEVVTIVRPDMILAWRPLPRGVGALHHSAVNLSCITLALE
jgi:hypothetical protein